MPPLPDEAVEDEDDNNQDESVDSTGIMNLLGRQHKIRFKKLLVPMAMRSPYWKYFGFPSMDGTTLTTKEKIVCALCRTVLTYNRNTTNLKTHLKSKHKNLLRTTNNRNDNIKLESQTELISNSSGINDNEETEFVKPMPDLEPGEILETTNEKYIIIENNHDVMEEMDHQSNLQDFEEGTIDYDIFLKNRIVGEEMSLENFMLDMIITDLMPFKFVEQRGFRTLIEKLTNMPFPSTINFDEKIDELYNKKKGDILLQMTNEFKGRNYSLSLEKWTTIYGKSFLTISSTTIEPETEVEMNNVTIKVALSKINMKTFIVDVIHYTDDIPYNDLLNMYNLDITKCISIVANYKDLSLSHFSQSFDIPVISCFMSIIKSCVQKCINSHELDKYFSSTNLYWTTKWMSLSEIEDYDVQAIVQCLSPLKVIFDLLNNKVNTIPNSSVIKPLITQLIDNYYVIDSESDSYTIQQIKHDIKQELLANVPENPFLLISSFLDPRFTNILNIKESNIARQMIRQKLAFTDTKKSLKRLQVNRIDSRSGLDYFFSSPKPNTNQDKLEQEFDKFLGEESCTFDKCPIAWWAEEGYVYPNLSKIATKYTTVPACIYEIYPIGTKDDINYQEKRFSIDDCPEKLIYLYLNKQDY